ncbi:SGT1-domain-containing protein [Rhizodiscina lignyota]|uniref:SGT1-domain-containing protein n=1 Tax=Rhizodiscina lignyota TaxID=1504668 RepID=A0A9P4I8C4_9PEZI|nr:SGT1-domain-containing protein [Rhizodiscina lignyota]
MDFTPQDDFKWFGEGFEGFPKRLPDDTVEYIIYVIDSKLNDAQVRSQLLSIQKTASDLVKQHLRDYIWQRDSFNLELLRENNKWLLRGTTNYGDSVADEWVIVYMLRGLSRTFNNAWIRVFDTDGEFLLGEAANALPKWLNPEIADNRVWLNSGRLLIIPPGASVAKPGSVGSLKSDMKSLKIEEAISIISKDSNQLTHTPEIEDEAFYRIRSYPAGISENLHHALVTIPRSTASILHRSPSYISAAVEAFYLRDPISLRPLKAANKDGLKFPPDDLVTVSIRFSKVQYAQLRGQEFDPPPMWKSTLADSRLEEKRFMALDIGMKITCGFEMLLSDPANRDKKAVREINVLLEDIASEGDLPTDEEMAKWDRKEDDDKWLDINFEDFEQELSGHARNGQDSKDPSINTDSNANTGFGDKSAQENLRKMVSRFEAFLNSEDAENAEHIDDMDFDDDDEGSDDDSDNDEADDIDEEEFDRAMREMMKLPPEQRADAAPDVLRRAVREIEEYNESDDEAAEDAEEIKKMAEAMERELRGLGALDIHGDEMADLIGGKGKGKEKQVLEK